MKRIISIIGLLLTGMLLAGMVSAEYGTIETWKTGSNDIVVHVYDRQSGVDLTGVTCTLDILDSTFAVLVDDAAMEDSGNGWYNYTYVQNTAGTYQSRVKCLLGTNGSSTTTSFKLVANTLNDTLDSLDTAINLNSSLLETAIGQNATMIETALNQNFTGIFTGQETISGDLNATELAILLNATLLADAIDGNQSETNTSIGDIRDTLNASIGDVLIDIGNILDNQTTIYNKMNDLIEPKIDELIKKEIGPSIILSLSFEENEGSVLHDTGVFGNDGFCQYLAAEKRCNWTLGKQGWGVFLDGFSYLNITYTDSINATVQGDELTIALDIKPLMKRSYLVVFNKDDFDDNYLMMEANGSISVGATRGWDNVSKNTTTGLLVNSNWHRISWVINGTSHKIYIDGVFREEIGLPTPFSEITGTNPTMWIGGNLWQLAVNGTMDEVVMYNRILSDSEIYADYLGRGRYMIDKIDAAATQDNVTNLPLNVWTYAPRTLSAFGFNVGLSSFAVDLIWDELQVGHTTPGTFGYYLNYTLSEVPSKGLNSSQDATLTGIRDDIGIYGAYDQCLACMIHYNVSDGNIEADMDGVFTNQTKIIRRCRHVNLGGY